MINPIAGYTARGFIWYQGESDRYRYATYAEKMADMVATWREMWGDDSMPFYFAQIAPFEYLAKFNMGYDDVPFKTWMDVTVARKYSAWSVISQENRGDWRDIYDLPFNHYVNRMGLDMPYTKEVLDKFTPFKYSDPNTRTTDATVSGPEKDIRQDDHFGFGSLLFLNDEK